ncbi:hypothetical protein E4T39_02527 [Aureobasidium subglaciale]|nr:hypothetical protein E4T39_02527 [Aureobasidium subglaciale]
MCLVSVKEDHDDYAVPARVVRRDRRRSPPRTTRVSRAYYEEPPRTQEPTYIIQQSPQPPPQVIAYSPPFEQHDHHDHHTHYDPPPPPPPAPASERHSHVGPQYVEVTPSSRSSSTSSSSSDDGRSKTTSHSRATGPRSEYHLREKEHIRERRSHDRPPRKDEYDTYRYVQPPHGGGNLGPRSSQIDDPRASRSSYNRRDIVVEGGREREYRR